MITSQKEKIIPVILSKDEDFDILFVEIDFSGYHKTCVRLWPEDHIVRNLPLMKVVLTVVHSREKMGQKIKVIACTCSKEPLRSSGLNFIERRTYHAACCLENIHKNFYVIPCEIHKMFVPLFGGEDFVFNCVCKTLVGENICQNSINIRYILNFVSPKICVDIDRLPVECKSRLVKIDDHLKKIKNEPFFIFVGRKKESVQV